MDFRRILNIGSNNPEPAAEQPLETKFPAPESSGLSKLIDAVEPSTQQNVFGIAKPDHLAFEVTQDPLSSWQEYVSLKDQISDALKSLPPEFQAQEEERYLQLENSLEGVISLTSGKMPDQEQNIPDSVLQALKSFLAEVQSMENTPNPLSAPVQDPQLSKNPLAQPFGLSGDISLDPGQLQESKTPITQFSGLSGLAGNVDVPTQENPVAMQKPDHLAFEVTQDPLSSWQEYLSLEGQISTALDSLPPDLQSQERARYDQLVKDLQPIIDLTSFHLPDQEQQIPDSVLQALKNFLAEVQSLTPPVATPDVQPGQ